MAGMESIRLMLALAANKNWEVHHMDVKSAFLNGDLEEEVYVSQPAGVVVDGAEHKVLRLHKALYGLKQAPRAWNAKLDAAMVSLGFQRSSLEHGVYTHAGHASRLIIGVYVDDLIITGFEPADIQAFKEEMQKTSGYCRTTSASRLIKDATASSFPSAPTPTSCWNAVA